jgi:hypothetical protein
MKTNSQPKGKKTVTEHALASAKANNLTAVFCIETRQDGTPLFSHECTVSDVERWKHAVTNGISNLKHLAGLDINETAPEAQRVLADVAGLFLRQWPVKKDAVDPLLESLYRTKGSAFHQRWKAFHTQSRRGENARQAVPAKGINLDALVQDFASKMGDTLCICWINAAYTLSGRPESLPPFGDVEAYRLVLGFFKEVPGLEERLLDHTVQPTEAGRTFVDHFDLFWKKFAEPYAKHGFPDDRWTRHKQEWEARANGDDKFNHKQMPWSRKAATIKALLRRHLETMFT